MTKDTLIMDVMAHQEETIKAQARMIRRLTDRIVMAESGSAERVIIPTKCVVCGVEIPEGRMVCPNCTAKVEKWK